jgi:hypothetical protein
LGRTGAAIRLERPGALAVGLHGVLYVADDGRDQIVERLPSGRFRILAGTGKAGFSGDGGLATRAELNGPRGMAVGTDGTLYVADSANNRVRAIASNGLISTIAGNGKGGWVKTGTPALAAAIGDPSAVTVGSGGRLYIAAFGDNEVVRLEKGGTLTEIAENRRYGGVYGVGGPAIHASPDLPTSLAFDRAHNLYLAGFAVKTLLMITPKGSMRLPAGIGTLYNEGGTSFATAPDGAVLATNYLAIVRLTPHGMVKVFDLSRPVDGVTGFLPEGIAVASNGDIYVDTWYGNGYANKTALMVTRLGKKPRVLWEG